MWYNASVGNNYYYYGTGVREPVRFYHRIIKSIVINYENYNNN